VKLLAVIYFASFAVAICWFALFAAVVFGLIDSVKQVSVWPLVTAVVVMIASKMLLRSTSRKAANG